MKEIKKEVTISIDVYECNKIVNYTFQSDENKGYDNWEVFYLKGKVVFTIPDSIKYTTYVIRD